jgi:hypothetical protein
MLCSVKVFLHLEERGCLSALWAILSLNDGFWFKWGQETIQFAMKISIKGKYSFVVSLVPLRKSKSFSS